MPVHMEIIVSISYGIIGVTFSKMNSSRNVNIVIVVLVIQLRSWKVPRKAKNQHLISGEVLRMI